MVNLVLKMFRLLDNSKPRLVVGFKSFEQTVSFDLKPGGGADMMNALDKDLGNVKVEFEEKVLDNVTVTSNSNPGLRLGIDRKVFGGR